MDVYYQHHLLLVEGVYLLLKDVVKEKDIEQSARLLRHYCYLIPSMYGKLFCCVGSMFDVFCVSPSHILCLLYTHTLFHWSLRGALHDSKHAWTNAPSGNCEKSGTSMVSFLLCL